MRFAESGALPLRSPDPDSLRVTVEPWGQGQRELGWIEGQNLAPIEVRWTEGKQEHYPALLDELLPADLGLLSADEIIE